MAGSAVRAEAEMALHPGIPTGVHVLFERGGQILLMRRSGTGFFDGMFTLPGGHVEHGESVFEAAVREVAEELGIAILPETLSWLGVVHRRSDTNRIDFFLRSNAWEGEPCIAEPHKCDALGWFPRSELPEPLVPYVGEALAQSQVPWMLETGWAHRSCSGGALPTHRAG